MDKTNKPVANSEDAIQLIKEYITSDKNYLDGGERNMHEHLKGTINPEELNASEVEYTIFSNVPHMQPPPPMPAEEEYVYAYRNLMVDSNGTLYYYGPCPS